MAHDLAQLELALLCLLALCLLLLSMPVPRPLPGIVVALLVVQVAACFEMSEAGDDGREATDAGIRTTAELIGAGVVPGLTAVVLVVLLGSLARANARLRRPSAGSSRPAGAGEPPEPTAPASPGARSATGR